MPFVGVRAIQLERSQVVEGIFPRPDRDVYEGHQDIADDGTVLGFEEEAVFSVEHAAFNESLDDIVGKGGPRHPQKESQFRPSPPQVVNCLAEPSFIRSRMR